MNKIHFKSLDGMRAIAALLVVIGHIELIKKQFGFSNYFDTGPIIFNLGDLSVTFFFVLSGFLITYLLLHEEHHSGKIDVKRFYLRRILRIWPVYYLVIVCTYLLMYINFNTITFAPSQIPENLLSNFYLTQIFFLPNISQVANPICFQNWSIGIEEQFYLFWPLIFIFIKKSRTRIITLICIIGIIFGLRVVPVLISILGYSSKPAETIGNYFIMARFDNMAIGGLLAITFYLKKTKWLKSFSLPLVFILMISIYFKFLPQYGTAHIYYSFLFAILIYYLITKQNVIILNYPILQYTGKISYGLYMYHLIAIFLSINLISSFKIELNSIEFNITLYVLTLLLTFALSIISYHLMEKKVLKLKDQI